MTSWVKLSENLWGSLTRVEDENSFRAFIKSVARFRKTFSVNGETLKRFRAEENRWLGTNSARNAEQIAKQSRVWCRFVFSHVGSAEIASPNRNPNKSHDVWGSMTSGALFSREWKRSTYNKSEICLDYLSRAIHIQRKAFGASEIDESSLRRGWIYIKIHRRFTRNIAAGNEGPWIYGLGKLINWNR